MWKQPRPAAAQSPLAKQLPFEPPVGVPPWAPRRHARPGACQGLAMTFPLFLRITVIASAACASILATLTVAGAVAASDPQVLLIAGAWWLTATALGVVIGRGDGPSRAISTLLADAPMTKNLPEQRTAKTLINRLWPLAIATLGAAVFMFYAPQVPGMAAGFPIIWALSWRRQESAVKAIEGRDGVRFFIERSSPLSSIKLAKTPWFRTEQGFRADA